MQNCVHKKNVDIDKINVWNIILKIGRHYNILIALC